ncbi:MAG: GNAT family N-acetyltransferase [Candidatus Rokuibacteriota bacterium]|nr:MAG: GNAT family N-acetyltransferase [Candidatus Rokubacteria bacterium]
MGTARTFEIRVAAVADDEVVGAFARLLPQLVAGAAAPPAAALREIIEAPCNTVLLARDLREDRIVGTLTLVVFRVPSGVRAWIEDVVVDEPTRRRGVGEALTREAIRLAHEKGAQSIELTSRPSREAANRLYRRLGFTLRQTNLYRYSS